MSTNQIVTAVLVLLLAGAAGFASAAAPAAVDMSLYDAAEEDAGFVESVELNGPRIRINGTLYYFTSDAYVEVRGVKSVPTLLTTGANVYLRFVTRDGQRQVVYLRQVPDSARTLAR